MPRSRELNGRARGEKILPPRIHVAALFAHLAMRPTAVGLLLPLFRLFPAMLTRGAGWSGKVKKAFGALAELDANRPVI